MIRVLQIFAMIAFINESQKNKFAGVQILMFESDFKSKPMYSVILLCIKLKRLHADINIISIPVFVYFYFRSKVTRDVGEWCVSISSSGR